MTMYLGDTPMGVAVIGNQGILDKIGSAEDTTDTTVMGKLNEIASDTTVVDTLTEMKNDTTVVDKLNEIDSNVGNVVEKIDEVNNTLANGSSVIRNIQHGYVSFNTDNSTKPTGTVSVSVTNPSKCFVLLRNRYVSRYQDDYFIPHEWSLTNDTLTITVFVDSSGDYAYIIWQIIEFY